MDRELNAYMMINVDNSGSIADLIKLIESSGEILEAYFVAGDCDYILKIATRDTKTLAELVNKVKAVKSVKRTETPSCSTNTSSSTASPRTPAGSSAGPAFRGTQIRY